MTYETKNVPKNTDMKMTYLSLKDQQKLNHLSSVNDTYSFGVTYVSVYSKHTEVHYYVQLKAKNLQKKKMINNINNLKNTVETIRNKISEDFLINIKYTLSQLNNHPEI